MIDAEEIDRAHVPRARSDVAFVEIDGEAVIVATVGDVGELLTHWLNPVGSVVWQCLDGAVSLAELAVDLAAAFDVPPDVVANDVVQLCRSLGRVGLLEDVAAADRPRAAVEAAADVHGLPIGATVPRFSRPDLDGREVGLEALRGRRALLVHWSPGCGFCARIAGELAAAHLDLEARGTDLVLLAFGSAAENRALLDGADLRCRVLLYGGQPIDLFRGLGTPCAYLVDEQGAIASGLAVGALEVPALARRAAHSPSASAGDPGAVG